MFFKVGGRGKTKLTHNNADEAAPSWGVVRSFFSSRGSQQPTSSRRGPGSSSRGPSCCPLFIRVRGRRVLRTSPLRSSRKLGLRGYRKSRVRQSGRGPSYEARGSGLLHGSSGTWVSDNLQGPSKSRRQRYADVHG